MGWNLFEISVCFSGRNGFLSIMGNFHRGKSFIGRIFLLYNQ